jgi:putative copper export protein
VTFERTATLIALIQLFGAATFQAFVVRPMQRASPAAPELVARMAQISSRTASIAATALVALAFVRLDAQVTALFDGWHAAGAAGLGALLLSSLWGRAWLLFVAASLVAAIAPALGRRLDVWMVPIIAVAIALSGHAAQVLRWAIVTVPADMLHTMAAGAWIGGVFMVLAATGATRDPAALTALVRRFNRVALVCAPIVVATGLVAAAFHLRSFAALLSSIYGNQLAVKVFFVLLALLAGAWNWRRATRALAAGNIGPLRLGTVVELAVALTVIAATAKLVVTPPPESVAAESATHVASVGGEPGAGAGLTAVRLTNAESSRSASRMIPAR